MKAAPHPQQSGMDAMDAPERFTRGKKILLYPLNTENFWKAAANHVSRDHEAEVLNEQK